MPDTPDRYKLNPERLGEGLTRSLYDTIDEMSGGRREIDIYRTSLTDDGKEFGVNITAEMRDGVMHITEDDSRYRAMEPLEGEIDLGGRKVVVRTNKLPYGMKEEFDPEHPPTPEEMREQAEGRMGYLITEAVQRFVVGANYRIGLGPLTDEEKKESYEVPYNRKRVLEDLLRVVVVLGSGFSLMWLLSRQGMTAKVTATGPAAGIVYVVLIVLVAVGIFLFGREPMIRLLGGKRGG
jgi:hypothetical protein